MLLVGGAISVCGIQTAEAEVAGDRSDLLAQSTAAGTPRGTPHHGRRRGQRPRRRPTPRDDCAALPPVSVGLTGVFSVAERDVWAVGPSGTIVHYDGCWRAQPSPTKEFPSASELRSRDRRSGWEP